jgi:hypothetical protein
MQNISFYIAYSLIRQECVIVPGFGAFVISDVETENLPKENEFSPPSVFLGFNSDIRHNDGLLANTIAKGEKISYQEACLNIRQYVDLLNTQLKIQGTVAIPWVGILKLSTENKLLFEPAAQMSCNAASFGMQPLILPTLVELEALASIRRRKRDKDVIYLPIHRQLLRWTASAAATVAMLFLTSAPLNESDRSPVLQKAVFGQFVRPLVATTIAEADTLASENVIETPELSVEEPTPAVSAPEENPNQTYYYIVVASVSSEAAAREEIKLSRYSDFSDLNVIGNGNRYRIYVRKFADKPQAETYLSQFRRDYSQHSSAWLLTQ